MSILDQLSSALKHRDETPNIVLAEKIAASADKKAINELLAGLQLKNQPTRQDCLKVLYEIAERKPKLIAAHAPVFITLLKDKNNRMQWGAMHALRNITVEVPAVLYEALPKIMDAAEQGSVITRDNAMHIMVKLCEVKSYEKSVFPLMLEQLQGCPENQLAMYAEMIATVVNSTNKTAFRKVLEDRIPLVEKETKKKRLVKLLEKV